MQNHENFTFVPNDHVSLSLMCRVLGVWTKSVPALCTSQRINEYSRRKPYDFGDVGEQLYGVTGTYESKLLQNNFGMVPAIISKPTDGATSTNGLVGQWGQWQPPQPGHAKRLDDFRMYWHLATEHVKSVEYSSGAKPSLMPYTADFWAKVTFTSEYVDRIVTLSDMSYGGKYIGDMYLTVVIASCNASGNLYGGEWIVAQSAKTLSETIRTALMGGLGKDYIDVSFNLYNAGISTLVSSFSKYFLAVGFAPKLSGQTSLPTISGSLYHLTQPNRAMPLALVSPDMYNKGFALATIGEMSLPSGGETLFNVYVDFYRLNNSVASAWVSRTTKNGKSGCQIELGGQFKCEIDRLEPESAVNDGYLVFYIYMNTDKSSKAYYVMMKKGCANAIDEMGKKYIYLSLSNYGVITTPDQADATNADVKDAVTWLRNKFPEDDAEPLTDRTVFIPDVTDITKITIEVMGAPSGWTANNVLAPNVTKDGTTHPSIAFSITKNY